MIESKKWCSASRCCLGVLLVLGLATPLLAGEAAVEVTKKPSQWLKNIRGEHHGDYSSIVLEFDGRLSFQRPVVNEREVHTVFQDAGTAAAPFRRYKGFDSWLRLEKDGDNLRARIGIPKDFPRVTYARAKGPERLIIRFSREEDATVSSAAATLPLRENPEAATPEEAIGQTRDSKTSSGPDRAVVESPPPPEAPTRRSYNFQDIDIRQVLSALAQDQEINLILPPEVTGKITVHLHQLTLEEAIRGITMAGGFTFTKQDDSYYVYKPKDVRDPQSDTGIIRAPVAGSPDGSTKLVYNFRDLDIRQALSAMAREQNINVIIAPEVTGKITVHLNNINADEAIRAVAMAGSFAYKKQEDLYYVYKPKVALDPLTEQLQIRAFRLKFAAIDKVQEILTAIPGMRTVRLHESSKTIIVEDTPENIAKIETLLRSWDVAPRQVLIEARIMQVTLTDDMSLGVEWQKVFSNLTIGTTGFVAGGPGLTGKLLTAAGSSDQFAAAIQALQTKTQVNTLSTPKILALHGKPSRVQVGGRQGYKTNTFTPTGTTENISFLDTGTILDITPYIDDKDNVLLDVKPQINSVTFDTAGNPNQKTTTVSTSLLAKDGQTVFIGGLIEDTKTGTRNAVPCLGEIPGLALLFGQLREGIGKSELIVLITPQIIDLEQRNVVAAEAAGAVEKTNKLEDALGKEPLPLPKRLLEDFP